MCSIVSAFRIAQCARCMRPCSTRRSTSARGAPCTVSWRQRTKCASAAISCAARPTPSRSWWPRDLESCGAGISPSSKARRSGPSYYLYVILDVFSRYVVGYMISERESAELAEAFIAETCAKEGVCPDQLTLHADRGSAMTSKVVAQLLSDLGVTKTHSRPHVSNDNPHSEAQFKTLKYRPSENDRFGSLLDARQWARAFFDWYNHEHRHSGIGLLTPAIVHRGQATMQVQARQKVLSAAYAAHPERFVRGHPIPPELPTAVWINPPATTPMSEPTAAPS